MVSHRLTTVQNADMILVVQQGRVIETGTHSELIKKKRPLQTPLNLATARLTFIGGLVALD